MSVEEYDRPIKQGLAPWELMIDPFLRAIVTRAASAALAGGGAAGRSVMVQGPAKLGYVSKPAAAESAQTLKPLAESGQAAKPLAEGELGPLEMNAGRPGGPGPEAAEIPASWPRDLIGPAPWSVPWKGWAKVNTPGYTYDAAARRFVTNPPEIPLGPLTTPPGPLLPTALQGTPYKGSMILGDSVNPEISGYGAGRASDIIKRMVSHAAQNKKLDAIREAGRNMPDTKF